MSPLGGAERCRESSHELAGEVPAPRIPAGPQGRAQNAYAIITLTNGCQLTILVREIEEAVGGQKIEIIEDYPADPRGASFLLLGFTEAGMPIHAVCALTEVLVIITLYRPDPSRWVQWRRRREV